MEEAKIAVTQLPYSNEDKFFSAELPTITLYGNAEVLNKFWNNKALDAVSKSSYREFSQ